VDVGWTVVVGSAVVVGWMVDVGWTVVIGDATDVVAHAVDADSELSTEADGAEPGDVSALLERSADAQPRTESRSNASAVALLRLRIVYPQTSTARLR